MSCKECDKAQDRRSTAYYRWKVANVAFSGCKNHLREIFDVLDKAQKPSSPVPHEHDQTEREKELIEHFRQQHKNLVDALKRDEKLANAAILATPTSAYRAELTAINILRLDAIREAEK